MTPSTRRVLAVGAGVLAMLVYAGQFVFSRWSFQRTLSLWDLAALRFAVAGLLMLPVVARHGFARGAGVGWGRGLVLTATAGGPYTLVMYAGLTWAPAGHGAVIIPGATPVVSALLVWLWFGERPGPTRLAGLALIVAGLGLVGWPAFHTAGHDTTWVGDLLLAVAGVLWALFTVLARRWHVDPLRGTAVMWVLALLYLPAYLALAPYRLLAAPAGELVFQALYQGVGVAVVALVLYAWAIRVLGPGAASLFMPTIPVLGVLLAVPVLGEAPLPVQLAGMLGVSAGMLLATWRSSTTAEPS